MKSKSTSDQVRSSTVDIEKVEDDSPRLSRSENEDEVAPVAEEVAAFKPSPGLYIAFAALAVITLMVALDGTSLSVSLPILAQKLHGSAIEIFWGGTSFLLCSTVFMPSFASFSHIFGRTPLIITALVFFTIGAIVAGVANDVSLLLVGRSLQGLGGGGLMALIEIVVTDLIPLRRRGSWNGVISGMWAVGSVTGPIIGGAFAQTVTWRWIFFINLPFAGVAFALIPIFLRLNKNPQNLRDQLKRVDWIGSVIFIGSTTSFLIPVTWGGVLYAWDSWRTLVPLIVGACGLIGFVFYEGYVATEPLIRMVVFKGRTNAASFLGALLHGMTLWCLLYYQPLYYEAVKGQSPVIAGVSLFPSTFTVAPAAFVTGLLVSYLGKYRFAIWTGWFLTVLGVGLLCKLDVDTSIVAYVFLNLVSGLGMGILFPATAFPVQAANANKDQAFAVSMYTFMRSFGQAIGVAIGGVIFQNQMARKLRAYPDLAAHAADYSQDASGLVRIIKAMPAGLQKDQLRQGYADSLRTVYAVLCGLAFIGFVTSFFIEEIPLDRVLETEQSFRARTTAMTRGAMVEKADEEGKPTHLPSAPSSSPSSASHSPPPPAAVGTRGGDSSMT